jgi:hypothetical protein
MILACILCRTHLPTVGGSIKLSDFSFETFSSFPALYHSLSQVDFSDALLSRGPCARGANLNFRKIALYSHSTARCQGLNASQRHFIFRPHIRQPSSPASAPDAPPSPSQAAGSSWGPARLPPRTSPHSHGPRVSSRSPRNRASRRRAR